MTPPNPWNIRRVGHFNPRRPQPGNQPIIVRTPKRRMRLLRRTKILLHSQMHLHAPALKPASSALSQLGRLRDLTHPEHARIEPSSGVFAVNRHGKLHVIDGGEW